MNPQDIMPNFHADAAFPSPVDARDYQWEEVGFGSVPFDWSVGCDIEHDLVVATGSSTSPVQPKNQGSSSSCGGQAWAMYGAMQEGIITKSFEERSAKYIYAQTYVSGGGSGGRDNNEIYSKQGIARETLCPSYEGGNTPTEAFMERKSDITEAARTDAKLDMSKSYAVVGGTYGSKLDIDAIAQAVRDTQGVVIGVTGSNNGTWLTEFPVVPKDGASLWRHWLYVYAAKMINGKKCLGVINSWGKSAGVGGKQWITEDYLNTRVHDSAGNYDQYCVWEAWTCVYNSDPVPVAFKYTFKVPITYGMTGLEVVALQTALQIDGEFTASVPCTGNYLDITRQAVLAFQVKYAVASSAEIQTLQGRSVGPKTRLQLNKLFAN